MGGRFAPVFQVVLLRIRWYTPFLAARVRRKPKSALAPRHHDWDLPEEEGAKNRFSFSEPGRLD